VFPLMTDDPLRSAIASQTAALIAVAVLSAAARPALDAGPAYPFKAAAAFAIILGLVVVNVRRNHPFRRFGGANQVTTSRAVMLALVAGLIGEPASPLAAGGAAVAGAASAILDGFDGWIARRTRMTSTFGTRFDMEMDAALILVLAILTWQFEKAGPWIVTAGLLRYVFVAAGWVWPWMQRPLTPTLRGRLICVVQIGALIVALLPAISPGTSHGIAAAGLVALCYSFLVDTRWLWRRRNDPP
jgi:phosphatidylglycerophosphate synthase